MEEILILIYFFENSKSHIIKQETYMEGKLLH
jgi:hypothetical protein